MFGSMGQTNVKNLGNGGTMDGDVTITGDLTVSGGIGLTLSEVIEGTSTIDVTNTEALLVRKNSDGGDVFIVDSTNTRVGIGVTPSYLFHAESQVDGNYVAYFKNTDADNGYGVAIDAGDDANVNALQVRTVGGSNLFVVNGGGNVGIGTSSPAVKLDVYGSLNLRSEYNLTWGGTAGANIPLIYGKSGDGGHLAFHSQGTDGESMRIDASGNVGIGTDSPDGKLHSHSGSAGSVSASVGALEGVFENSGDAGITLLSPDASFTNVIFGSASDSIGAQLKWKHDNDLFRIGTANVGASLAFETANTAEAMRIDSSGNVGIGVSSLEAQNTQYTALQLGGNANIIAKTSDQASNPLNILQNAYNGTDTNWKKIREDQSSRYSQLDGVHSFFTDSGTGSADSVITWTTNLIIDSNSRISLSNNDSGASNTVFGYLSGVSLASGGDQNCLFGHHAGNELKLADNNIAIGYNAMFDSYIDDTQDASVVDNIFIGKGSGSGTWVTAASHSNVGIGSNVMDAGMNGALYNVAIGTNSLSALTQGDYNTVVGAEAGLDQTTGAANCLYGFRAGYDIVGGGENTFIGASAGLLTTAVVGATLIGREAGGGGVITTAANHTTAVGYQALYGLTSGAENVAVGYQALQDMTTGASNVAIGYQSQKDLNHADADCNVTLGNFTMDGVGVVALASCTAVGHNALSGVLTSDASGSVAVGRNALNSLTSGQRSTAVGYYALANCDDGDNNTAIGWEALEANAGDSNTAVGAKALKANTGGYNVALGNEALTANEGGSYNIAIGHQSMLVHTGGLRNVAIGAFAMKDTDSGSPPKASDDCILIGYDAGGGTWANQDCSNLIGIGTSALAGALAGDTADGTIAIGRDALTALTTGASNTAVGYQSAKANNTGYKNTALGYDSFITNSTGYSNTAIGSEALYYTNSDENVAVGDRAGGYTTGDANTYAGFKAGFGASGAETNNVGIGHSSLLSVTSGSYNTAVGALAGDAITTSSNCTLIGRAAGSGINSTDANGTVCLGNDSGESITSAIGSTALGKGALQSNQTGDLNTAVGFEAGKLITGGLNTVVGYQTADSLASGTSNTVVGGRAFYAADGSETNNTIIGTDAGNAINHDDTDGNVIIGHDAGSGGGGALIGNIIIGRNAMNSTGNNTHTGTVAIGFDALTALTSGAGNTAVGYQALDAEDTGDRNTAVGYNSLTNVNGADNNSNTGLGYNSGDVITTGTNNTCLGANTDPSANSGANQTMVGSGVTGVADNAVVLGNSAVTKVYMAEDGAGEMYANGTINTSDKRLKENINDTDLGLSFVNALRPVSYKFIDDKKPEKLKYGIIAQEVQEVLKQSGNEDFAGITDKGDYLGADYVQFIAPLIKAVQELTAKVEALESKG